MIDPSGTGRGRKGQYRGVSGSKPASNEGERGCRTKITTEVADARKILEGYHHGLHRVIFYGDHTTDVKRLSRFVPGLKFVEEG